MTAAPYVAHLTSAGELVASKKFGEAEGEILRALSAAPTDAKALTLLALVRYKLGRLEDAHATYRQLAGAAPHDAGARRNLGLLSLKLGRIDEALPDLEMAVRIAPGDARAWSYLGYIYAKKGEVVQAAAAFRRAGQDTLANELDQAATVQRPPTPARGGGAFGRPVALAPPLPPMPGLSAEKRPPSVRRPTDPVEARLEAPAHAVPTGRESIAWTELGSAQRSPSRGGAGTLSGSPESIEPPQPREVETVPLLSFVLARLGQAPPPAIPPGAFRLAIADEAHARGDAILAGSGALKWERGVRRAQGRTSSEPLGREGGAPLLPVHGWRRDLDRGRRGALAAAAAGRRRPLRARRPRAGVRRGADLGGGRGARHGLRMLQFRGRGSVALELPADAIAIKVTDEKPTLISAARLSAGSGGWSRTANGCPARRRSSSAARARASCCSKRLSKLCPDRPWRPSGASSPTCRTW